MSYVEKTLGKNEDIYYVGKIHWSIYVPAAMMAVLSAYFVFFDGSGYSTDFALISVALAVVMFVYFYLRCLTTEMAVTDRRVIHKKGIILVRINEMAVQKVETCRVFQTIFERLMGVGTVKVTGTGGEFVLYRLIDDPFEFRNHIANVCFKEDEDEHSKIND